MRAIWLLPAALAGCAEIRALHPALPGAPDDLRDAPAPLAAPATPGEALYRRIVASGPEGAARSVLELSSDERRLLEGHIVSAKGIETAPGRRFAIALGLPANESAFICWYLGGFSSYAPFGGP